jgi:hypothetical protein
MRRTATAWLVVLLTSAAASAATVPVTTCGQVVIGRGELVGDLDCGLYGGTAAVTVRGRLDLNGFTITGNAGLNAVSCVVKCNVRGPGLITGANAGVSTEWPNGAKIRVRDVTIDGNTGAAVDGSTVSVKDSVITNNGTANPPVSFPFTGGVSGGRVKILDSALTNNFNFGVRGSKVRLIRSTATGNGTNPGCLANIPNWGCADVAGFEIPRVRASSTCGTSRRLAFAPFNSSWGVCAND